MLKIRKSTNKWVNDATQNLKENKNNKSKPSQQQKNIKTTAAMNEIETKGEKQCRESTALRAAF